MCALVDDLADYFFKKEIPPALELAVAELGTKNMRILSMHILHWLSDQERHGARQPMEVPSNSALYRLMEGLLKLWPEMAEVLTLTDGKCDFKEEVSQSVRELMLKTALARDAFTIRA